MSKTRIVELVLAVFIAVALWAYVINVVNPPTEVTLRNVPVDLTGQEVMNYNKLAIVGEGDYTVDVVLSGARKDIAGVTADDVSATADLSSMKLGQNYIDVDVKSRRDTLSVADVRSPRIQVYVEELVVVDKPLNINYSAAGEGYEPTILSYTSDVIAVSGARSIVEKVAEVRIDLDVTDLAIDSPRTETLSGIPLDANGNLVELVKLDDQIRVSAVIYAVKTVNLNVRIVGSPGYSATVRGNDFPTAVSIKGAARRLETLDSIDTEIINIDGIISDHSYTLEPILPAGVYLSDNNADLSGTITLVNVGKNSFTYGMDKLVLRNIPADCEVNLLTEGDISVTATSTLEIIQNVTENDIVPGVDLSMLEPGTYSLPIESVYGSGEINYEFVPSYVDVEIVSTLEEPDDGSGEGGENGEGSAEEDAHD